jgi:hypothetical protein
VPRDAAAGEGGTVVPVVLGGVEVPADGEGGVDGEAGAADWPMGGALTCVAAELSVGVGRLDSGGLEAAFSRFRGRVLGDGIDGGREKCIGAVCSAAVRGGAGWIGRLPVTASRRDSSSTTRSRNSSTWSSW